MSRIIFVLSLLTTNITDEDCPGRQALGNLCLCFPLFLAFFQVLVVWIFWNAPSQGLGNAKPSQGLGFVLGTGLYFICPWPTAKGQRQRKQDYRKARRWTTPSTLQPPLSATCLIHSGAFSIKAERLRLVKATKTFFPCVGREKTFFGPAGNLYKP